MMLLALLALTALSLAAPVTRDHVVVARTHDTADAHHANGFKLLADSLPARDARHRVALYARHDDSAKQAFDAWLDDAADPSSANYGRWSTPAELGARLVPPARIARLRRWLETELEPSQINDELGDVLVLDATTEQIEALFNCRLVHFHPIDEPRDLRARAHGPVHVPSELADDVAIVAGLTEMFGVEHQLKVGHAGRDGAATARKRQGGGRCPMCAQVTPQLLRSYYNMSDSLHASGRHSKVKQAVSGFEEKFSPDALKVFGQKIAKSKYPFVISETPGGTPNPEFDEGEGDLDVQYVMAMGENVPTWFWSVHPTYWILEWALDVLGTKDAPTVHSLSYGTSIQHQCDIAESWCHVLGYNSSAYVARTNTELQKLGGSGITVLVSAGDNGAPGRSNNGHCPLDPAAYCTLGGCDHSSSACDSVELSVTKAGQEIECILPLGAGGYGCMALASMVGIAPQNYSQIFGLVENLLQKQLGIADAGWDVDVEGNPHLYVPPGHSCSSIDMQGTLDNGVFEMKGYVFDPTETHVGSTFIDEFPGSSPYILSVGMTTILDPSQPEEVGSIENGGIVTGGGGFSVQEAQPAYQKRAVAQFFQNADPQNLPDKRMFDGTKRGFPDIAITGERYLTVGQLENGTLVAEVVSGTSASSPALAGMLSLINERRVELGLPTLGFLNPALYQLAEKRTDVFRDITRGNNRCTHVYCCQFGWYATPGWDPATGLGSIDYGNLYDALTSP